MRGVLLLATLFVTTALAAEFPPCDGLRNGCNLLIYGCSCRPLIEECNARAGNCGTAFCSGSCQLSYRGVALIAVTALAVCFFLSSLFLSFVLFLTLFQLLLIVIVIVLLIGRHRAQQHIFHHPLSLAVDEPA